MRSGVAHRCGECRERTIADQTCHAEIEAACLLAKYVAPLQAHLDMLEIIVAIEVLFFLQAFAVCLILHR